MKSRNSFIFWCSSKPTPHDRITKDNKPEVFTIELPLNFELPGAWSVRCLGVITAEVDFTQTNGDLMIYTDLIEYALVGHGYFPLIERAVFSGRSDLRFQESMHPFRRKVKLNYIRSISFKIADGNGKAPVWSNSNYDTLVCLKFVPEAPNFDRLFMDLTFVSNQSRDRFPKNSATEFTAQLPSVQQLDNRDWQVGLTKVTLPPILTESKISTWTVVLDSKGVNLPPIVIKNVKTLDEMISQFNHQAHQIIKDQFPNSTPTDAFKVQIKRNSSGNSSSSSDFVHRHMVFTTNQLSLTDIYEAFAAEEMYMGTTGQTKFIMMVKSSKGEWPHGGLFQMLGFNAGPNSTPPINNQLPNTGGTTKWTLIAADQEPFSDPNLGYPSTIECKLYKENGKPRLRFSYYGTQTLKLGLTIPKGMCNLLGLNTSGVTTKIKEDGSEVIRIEIGPGTTSYPHDVGKDNDNLVSIGYPPLNGDGRVGYIKNKKDYYQSILEGTTTSMTAGASGSLEIHDSTTKIPYGKVARVTCDLIKPEFVGDKALRMLDVVPLASASAGEHEQPKQYVFEPRHIKYYPLVKSSFQSVAFKVEDEEGETLPFVTNGVATYTLRFKK